MIPPSSIASLAVGPIATFAAKVMLPGLNPGDTSASKLTCPPPVIPAPTNAPKNVADEPGETRKSEPAVFVTPSQNVVVAPAAMDTPLLPEPVLFASSPNTSLVPEVKLMLPKFDRPAPPVINVP